MFSGSAELISFQINLISKAISQAELQYMNMHPPKLCFTFVSGTENTTATFRPESIFRPIRCTGPTQLTNEIV